MNGFCLVGELTKTEPDRTLAAADGADGTDHYWRVVAGRPKSETDCGV